MDDYHQKLTKSYVNDLPSPIDGSYNLDDLHIVVPKPGSVAFHRYGKEIAVTVAGKNFWFCYSVKVGSHKESVRAADVSEKSIQFHYNPEEKPNISADCNEISVAIFTHFRNPVRTTVQVKHKVFKP